MSSILAGAGWYNSIAYADNVDFSRSPHIGPTMTETGQILVASDDYPHIRVLKITEGPGVIVEYDFDAETVTFTASSAAFPWDDITDPTYILLPNHGHITDRALGVIYTLPNSAAQGAIMWVTGKQGSWQILQNPNQQILLGPNATTLGNTGSINSTDDSDTIQLLCINGGVNTIWRAISSYGNIAWI